MITNKHAQLIGIGRPSVLYPNFPNLILNTDHPEPHSDLDIPEAPNPGWVSALNTALIGAGVNTAWHCALMWHIGTGRWAGLKRRAVSDRGAEGRESDASTRKDLDMPRIGAVRSMVDMWRT